MQFVILLNCRLENMFLLKTPIQNNALLLKPHPIIISTASLKGCRIFNLLLQVHFMQLVSNGLIMAFGTDTHTHILDKAISRNQVCTCLQPAGAWLKKSLQCFDTMYCYYNEALM